jgi:protocatechuate 3,4-dioxygenase alpha subunit
VGPFFHVGLEWLFRADLAPEGVAGERVTVEGRVLDGDGAGVTGALLELWQANAQGKYDHPEDTQDRPLEAGFHGYGRVATDGEGRFAFRSVKPGAVPAPDGTQQAPHILVSVFARGLQRRLITRIYFPGEPANETDFALRRVEPARRATLVARARAGSAGLLEWNVVLQGAAETVFFDL